MIIECPRLKPKSSHTRHETEIEPYMERTESNCIDKYVKPNLSNKQDNLEDKNRTT